MPLVLTTEKREEIFVFVRKSFSDFPRFDSLVGDAVRKLIRDASTTVDIDMQFTKTLAERYLDMNAYLDKEQKQLLDTLKIILTATAIYLFSLTDNHGVTLFSKFEELQEAYPDLVDDLDPVNNPDDAEEVKNFLVYRNYLMLALKLVPAKGNKLFLLRMMERLEGANQEYITGTGQKRTVTRRITIYQREGDVVAIKKNAKRPKEIVEAEKRQKELERYMKMVEGKGGKGNKKLKAMTEEEKEAFLKQLKTSTTSPSTYSNPSPDVSPASTSLEVSKSSQLPPPMTLPAAVQSAAIPASAPSVSFAVPSHRALTTEEKIEKLEAMNQILLDEPYTGSFTEEIMTHILRTGDK